jgi:hypothetical protein
MYNTLINVRLLRIIISILFCSGVAMAVSEPKFTIEATKELYEIRKYGATIVAETTVENKFDEAGNSAFRILADYIFGNNKAKVKIDMTAPVSQQPVSEKIAMTAPVSQVKKSDGYLVQFTMPENFNLDTLPEPIDKRVVIREIPARRLAVFKYSGSWSEERYNEKLSEFLAALKKDNLATIGEPVFARFNSPFSLWFLRRNEIWFELETKPSY